LIKSTIFITIDYGDSYLVSLKKLTSGTIQFIIKAQNQTRLRSDETSVVLFNLFIEKSEKAAEYG